jgi:hypothetical protein
MQSSGMLRRVALVRTDFSEVGISSVFRVTRIGELGSNNWQPMHAAKLRLVGTTNLVPSSHILVSVMMGVLRSSETSFLTRGAA